MTTAPGLDGQDLLNSINAMVRHSVQPAKRIEQLGNGAAFLHLLSRIHPELVQTERVIANPADVHEVTQNLRLLASVFEQAPLKCRVDTQKLAQMKYSENYHLAAFLVKAVKDQTQAFPQISAVIEEESSPQPKKFKVTIRNQPTPRRIMKEEPASITLNDLCALQSMSRHRLQPIEPVELKELPVKQNKLTKIASILQIGSKTRSEFSQKYSNGKIATLESSFCFLSLTDSPAGQEMEAKMDHQSEELSHLSCLPQPTYESWSEMQEENEENTSQCEKMECETVCFGVKSCGISTHPSYEDSEYPFSLQPWPPKNPFLRYCPQEDLLLREM